MSRRAGRAAGAVPALVLVLGLLLAPGSAAAAPAPAAPASGGSAVPAAAQVQVEPAGPDALSLEVLRLDAVADGDGEVRIRTRVRNGSRRERTEVRLLATLHRDTAARGRWSLHQALDAGAVGNPIHAQTVDVGPVPARGSRVIDLVETVAELGLARSGREGVYPLRLQLLVDDEVVDEVTTSVVVVPREVAEPVTVSTLLPMALPPARDAEGVVVDGAILDALADRGRVAGTLQALRRAPRFGATLALDGATLADVAELADGFALRQEGVVSVQPAESPFADRARTVLEDLNAVAGRPLVDAMSLPYASADLMAVVRSGALDEARRLVTDGAPLVRSHTGIPPRTNVLWPPAGIDATTLAAVRSAGVDSLVVSERDLAGVEAGNASPIPVRQLRVEGRTLTAFVPDPYLEEFLGRRDPGSPALAAQRILAEVALVYFELPGTPGRGLLLAPPTGSAMPAEVVGALAERLANAPFARTVPLSRLADRVEPVPQPVRVEYPIEARRAELPLTYTSLMAIARRALGSLAGVLAEPNGLPTRFDGLLLQSASVHYRGEELSRGRDLLRTVTATVNDLYSSVEIPSGPPVTFTAEEGQLPISIRSTADIPLRVLLTLQTARYEVEGGASRELVLEPGTTQILTFRLRALTPGGTSPVQVVVSDADGLLDLATGTVVVRSTAFSALALAVTVGAAVFLLLWWAAEVVRRRLRRPGRATADPRRGGDRVPVRAGRAGDERGGSTLKTLIVLAVVGVVLFDGAAVLVNQVQADEAAGDALRTAVQSAQRPEGRRAAALEEAAQAGLGRHGRAVLESAVLDERGLTVVVRQPARVLVLDRLGPLSDWATARVTKVATLQ